MLFLFFSLFTRRDTKCADNARVGKEMTLRLNGDTTASVEYGCEKIRFEFYSRDD